MNAAGESGSPRKPESAAGRSILMLCDWLPPDFGAVGQYAVGFASELAKDGNHVVLVGFSSTAATCTEERCDAGTLRTVRIRRSPLIRPGLARRAWWTLRANLALLWSARRYLAGADELRFTGSPAYLLHFVMPVARLRGLRTRYRITDFHPECLIAARSDAGLALRALQAVTNAWRRRVDIIEVLGEDQRRRLVECGVEVGRIELRRDPSPVSIGPDCPAAPKPSGMAGRKAILYSGNWGEAHEHETFVEGYRRFSAMHPGAASLWLNGTGSRVAAVMAAMEQHGLACVRTPPVPLDSLPGVLCAADAHLITLEDRFVGYVMPSKVYGCIASGRPVLFVGSEDSDVHALCRDALPPERYRRVATGDPEGVARALAQLLDPAAPVRNGEAHLRTGMET